MEGDHMTNVIHLNAGWSSMAELAVKHRISERTAWNWLKAGKVEKRETESGCSYRFMKPEISGKNDGNLGARITAIEVAVARLEKLEFAYAELQLAHDALLARMESIEHAHDWHVAVDGILAKRQKRLAKLKR